MRIVLTVPAFFPHSFGGGEVYVDRVARELTGRGHQVTVLTATGAEPASDVTDYEYRGVKVVAYSAGGADWIEAYSGLGPRSLRAQRSILSELKPDVVHVNGLKPAATSVCRELCIPHVVTAHHVGIACASGTLLRPDGGACECRMSPSACVPCVNRSRRPRWQIGRLLGAIPRFVYHPLGELLSRRRAPSYLERGLVQSWLIERSIDARTAVLDRAQLMIAPSKAIRDLLVRNGRNPDTIEVVPHGIDVIGRRALPPLGSRSLRFGYLGRLEPLKGLHVLLDAAASLGEAPAEVHVFGAARHPWHQRYVEECFGRYHGAVPVRLHGRVDHGALASAMETIDVLVVPSLVPEAFGLVVLEAFSAGRPVIVFPSGALPELVRDGVDGLVAEACSGSALARAMRRCIDAPGLVRDMAERTRDPMTMPAHVDALLRVYRRAMG